MACSWELMAWAGEGRKPVVADASFCREEEIAAGGDSLAG